MKPHIPFPERKTAWRGLLDLVGGSYPLFLFGGAMGRGLPVFHFHEARPETLEPYFRYIAENGYRTVDASAIAAWAIRGVYPGPRTIALCFDDAWASLWLVVLPLLKKFDLSAIAYVSPARVPADETLRIPWDPAEPFARHPFQDADRSEMPFCTWPELRALRESGRVDIQAHGWRHVPIPCASTPMDFHHPGKRFHPHDVPLVAEQESARLLAPDEFGAPLYPTRSRLSDALQWRDAEGHRACVTYVRDRGGSAFFDLPSWRSELEQCLARHGRGRFETPRERDRAILEELARSREILVARLSGHPVHQICFPWAVAGKTAVAMAAAAGFQTAFSDRLFGRKAVCHGDPPYRLMRLKHQLIPCLPGRNRKWFFGALWPAAGAGAPPARFAVWAPLQGNA